MGFSIINHPCGGTPIYGNTQLSSRIWMFGKFGIALSKNLRLDGVMNHNYDIVFFRDLGIIRQFQLIYSGWWFQTFLFFHLYINIWDVILPIDELIFFRG
jgi:hypothetical protein